MGMDKVEAIKRIKDHIRVHRIGEFPHIKIAEALSMAISALATDTNVGDKVEVVRCKDCKWYKEGELLAPNKFCFRLKHPTEDRNVGYNFGDEDFCSYGERNDNES